MIIFFILHFQKSFCGYHDSNRKENSIEYMDIDNSEDSKNSGVETTQSHNSFIRIVSNFKTFDDMYMCYTNEKEIYNQLNENKNILKIKNHCADSNSYTFVYESVHFTLEEYLFKNGDEFNLCEQLLDVVDSIHQKGISINNLCFSNIFVTSNGMLKIYDFHSSIDYKTKYSFGENLSENRRKVKKLNLINFSNDLSSAIYIIGEIFGFDTQDIIQYWKYGHKNEYNKINNESFSLESRKYYLEKNLTKTISGFITSYFNLPRTKGPDSSKLLVMFK
ncbi:hypothetical protein H312_02896 [Anncaliia algerae PRA339]|uniref:Protein kinase domain-containing protein n=1 Tax=Anncaliia algerae PRA339 TaxID=1288291 RepID=A0A059EYB4_9MICR|nr:hypothetical protein H312_02896 [Anncaliia algerae PRA339]